MQSNKTTFKQKLFLLLLGVFLSVIFLEINLRLGGFILLSLQENRNRIAIKQKGVYRILTLGESTTFCGGVDSYPSQLEDVLNSRNTGIRFSVINQGVPGVNTSYILAHLGEHLVKYEPDVVVTMMGINDRNSLNSELNLFLESFKVYKLIKLLGLHLSAKLKYIDANKTKKIDKTRLLQLSEKNPFELGKTCHYDLGDYVQAEDLFKRAIELNPQDDRAYAELGWLYHDYTMNYKLSEQLFKKAIILNPKNENAYMGLGFSLREQKKFIQAEEAFLKGMELSPKNSDVYFEFARCYVEEQKYLQAERLLLKALTLNSASDSRNDKIYSALTGLYSILNKPQQVRKFAELVNKLGVKYCKPVTQYNYQEIYKILAKRKIKLVVVQYPVRSIEPLRKIFYLTDDLVFVDNEKIFKEVLSIGNYSDYFTDSFAGDFGHCTRKGNRLLAENIANVMLKEVFKK